MQRQFEDKSADFSEVWSEELTFLTQERESQAPLRINSTKTAGLALSGGGIRAAAFSLGVMQALNKKNEDQRAVTETLFDEVDYLSTVSGGGYAGAAVTWFRWLANSETNERDEAYLNDSPSHEDAPDADPAARLKSDTRKYKSSLAEFPKPNERRRTACQDALDYIRNRKNHLTPTFLLNRLSMGAVVFRTTILSLPIYLSLLVIGLLLFRISAVGTISQISNWPIISAFGTFYSSAGSVVGCKADLSQNAAFECDPVSFISAALVCICILIFVVWNLVFLIASRHARYGHWHYGFRRNSQRGIGVLTFATLGLIALWVATTLEHLVEGQSLDARNIIVGLFLGNGVGAYSFSSLLGGGKEKSQDRAKIVIIFIAFILLILNLTAAHEISEYLLQDSRDYRTLSPENFAEWGPILTMIALLVFLCAGFWANLNYVSLNRMYRDRLMETFMPDLRALGTQTTDEEAFGADVSYLSKMAQRPYHLVNAHVVLTGSTKAKLRGRTGDNFVLSPNYCGSRATGYKKTDLFGIKASQNENGTMTLATATAISGAAFNPRVGPSGVDTAISNPIVFSMMSYYNLRLGCWVGNPMRETALNESKPTFYREGIKGILNLSFREDARMVELTDGGHFENTGLYELLQRRTDVIFLADATADGRFNFKDLGFAIERARADMGIEIRFDDGEWDLTHLMPNSQFEEHYDKRYSLARRGFAVARIFYPYPEYDADQSSKEKKFEVDCDSKIGYLIYIKAVMTRQLPGDLYGYRGAHEEFPHQPISDQMFDEAQFEAYRELGFSLTADMSKRFSKKISAYLKDPDYQHL